MLARLGDAGDDPAWQTIRLRGPAGLLINGLDAAGDDPVEGNPALIAGVWPGAGDPGVWYTGVGLGVVDSAG